jgi:hypothetical protein
MEQLGNEPAAVISMSITNMIGRGGVFMAVRRMGLGCNEIKVTVLQTTLPISYLNKVFLNLVGWSLNQPQAMNRLSISLVFAVMLTAGCTSKPIPVVTSSLGRHALKGKTLAVGGFTARNIADYPGQSAEETIVSDAGTALQRRFKHLRVLTAEALWAAAGPPPTKISRGVPITIGHERTRDFLRRTHALGVDYLMWIDLMDNTTRNSSGQYLSTSRGQSRVMGSGGRRSTSYSSSITSYISYAAAGRSLGVTCALLDTASGKPVWRADCMYARGRVSRAASGAGYPQPPRTPLPPEETKLMQRITTAVIAELPK